MVYKVLIPQDIADEGKDYLRERNCEIIMGTGISVDIIKREAAECDAILARTAPYPAEVLETAEKLRVISRHGVGVDNIDVKRAEELGIYVTNGPESNSGSVAEHALGLIIAAARNFSLCERQFRAGNFEVRNQVIGVDLEGKTLGVAGVGKIGSLVARKASLGLDMKVIGYDPFLETFPEGIEKVTEWDELFRRSDFISLHMPSNDKTKGIVGKDVFDLMKPTAYLINAARGDIIDEAALASALKEKRIAGAALDVYVQEPPAPDNALFSLDNVFMAPHHASLTRECMVRMALHAAMGIDEVLSGKTPTWPVNHPKKPRAMLGGDAQPF